MKAYWLVRCNVKDADIYGEYIKLAGPAIEKHGGRYLVMKELFWLNSIVLKKLKPVISLKTTKQLTKYKKKQLTDWSLLWKVVN